ncbi:winged helix DNA-binding domain-containing protein [Allobranchiibius sp. GilTou73]|nr:crosslink repair DNA glycosylase YcaQ family protein [Allobranchiibius sp. GilTou73]UIJ36591.1 winged helix DNA-binding domain-containing protein [Allobranchiibius sp. GilTou73]
MPRGPRAALGPRGAGLPHHRRGRGRACRRRARPTTPDLAGDRASIGQQTAGRAVRRRRRRAGRRHRGGAGTWRVDPAQLGLPFRGRAALLSPLDRLVVDRKRLTEIFRFDYQLEMYKPVAKRRWGYFALPILYGDSFVGKLDAASDLDAGLLRVNAVHEDVDFTAAMTRAVDREIESLAQFLGLRVSRS